MYRNIRRVAAVLVLLVSERAWADMAQETRGLCSCQREVADRPTRLVIGGPVVPGQGPDSIPSRTSPEGLGSAGPGERDAERAARQQRERDFLDEIWTSP